MPVYITCAKAKKEEVVDKLLVLRHAKLPRSESGFSSESRHCPRLSPCCVSASIVIKVTTFDQNGLKTLPGDLSRPHAVETSVGPRELILPRAGYPTVPECRGVCCHVPEII